MDEFLKDLRNMIAERFSDAVSVEVVVTAECIDVTPKYKGEISGYSMKRIDGAWCSDREEE